MQERAREIGGKLDISSADAEGTRISVTVDIP
jgi:signal transduction histidine kinase